MNICPMCGMPQLDGGQTACQFCGFEDRSLGELTKKQLHDLMASYEYEITEDGGVRIKSVKNIRDIALRGSVALPSIVTEIADEAFSCCKFLARIILPNSLRAIGSGAFGYCRDLFGVFIPESVISIGRGAFDGCYDLRVISCAVPEKPAGWDSGWLDGCPARTEWSATSTE